MLNPISSVYLKGLFMALLLSSVSCQFTKNSSDKLFSSSDSYLTQFENSDQTKSPLDKREMKSITLGNNLEILLISSSSYNKSSAAMDVATGSLEDPTNALGMAHFLEHMLFLGTKKYPSVGEYSEYLSTHQGMSNAYTDREHTNYYFEVNTEAYEGALDRFSQFFIEPLFLQEYVEREMNAVHSEHQKNLNSDGWRKRRVYDLLVEKNHPRQKFDVGTLETLKKIKTKDLIDFYHKQYSANQMKLVLMSSLPLDAMAALAKDKFSAIIDNKRPTHKYSDKVYADKDLPMEVSIKTIKDLRELELIFPTPSQTNYWKSKPTRLITFLIGHEGKGSLLSLLKQKGLATSVGAWFDERNYAGEFHFRISLTEKGLEQKNDLIHLFFSYVKLLETQKLPQYIFDEVKTMSDIEFIYKEHMEGGSVASYYAAQLQNHPATELEKQTELLLEYNNDDYKQFLSYIKPDRLISILSTDNAKTDQTEYFYKVEYKKQSIKKELISLWNKASTHESFSLPEVNAYIPKNLKLLKGDLETKPRKLLDQNDGIFWFEEDLKFKQPKARVSLLLETPLPSESAENKVKTLLYQKMLEESLNEWKYNINLAGLDFQVAYHTRGVQITFEGYSELMPELIKEVAEKLHDLSITEEHFSIIKKDFIRGLENLKHEMAYNKALYELGEITKPGSIHYESYYNPKKNLDIISPRTIKEVQSFAKELFQTFSIEGVGYGNLVEHELKDSILYYYKKLGAKRLENSKRTEDSVYKIEEGKSLALILDEGKESPNHCWLRYIQYPTRDMKTNAITRVANSVLQPDFYHVLRTEKQLGYIVHSGLRFSEKTLGFIYLVQSPNYSPLDIENYFNEWEGSLLSKLEKLTVFELENLKSAISSSLREEDKTISEKHDTLHFEAITMNGQFHYKEELAKVTESLTKEDLTSFFVESLRKERKRVLTLYLDKEEKKDTKEKIAKESSLIQDKEEYKKNTPIF
jgi:insulysin